MTRRLLVVPATFAMPPYVVTDKLFLNNTYCSIDPFASRQLSNQEWKSKTQGVFSDASRWVKNSVPKSKSIVVLSGGSVTTDKT